jgi:hypothetical protein
MLTTQDAHSASRSTTNKQKRLTDSDALSNLNMKFSLLAAVLAMTVLVGLTTAIAPPKKNEDHYGHGHHGHSGIESLKDGPGRTAMVYVG